MSLPQLSARIVVELSKLWVSTGAEMPADEADANTIVARIAREKARTMAPIRPDAVRDRQDRNRAQAVLNRRLQGRPSIVTASGSAHNAARPRPVRSGCA